MIFSRYLALLIAVTFAASMGHAGDFDSKQAANWNQWRGPQANGFAPNANPPSMWSEQENIRWKVAIEGEGNATPIVWEDRIFLVAAVDTGRVDPNLPKPEEQEKRPFGITYPNTFYRDDVLCLDRETGEELWRRTAKEMVPHEGHHGDNSFASSSPTTDGERLYVWFGNAGCYCYDLSGELLWKKDLGFAETRLSFGEASSPVIHDGRLIIVRDQEGPSYIVVLDAASGDEIWRAARDEPSAWETPLVVQHDGRTQVITNGSKRVRSYDLKDGNLLWECGGQVANVTPSPVYEDGTVYCMSGYRGSALYAISLDAVGDISSADDKRTESVHWSKDRGTPYIPSPLLYKGRLYFNQSNDGILSCLDAKTGQQVMERTRMPGIRSMYASPVAAAGRIYFVGRDGTTLVIDDSTELNVIANNSLEDRIDASPAIVGDQIFLRGKHFLYCIAKP